MLRPVTLSPFAPARMLARPSPNFDSFQTVSVRCAKCRAGLFRYKKKNGLKSNLVKCFIERIVEDPLAILTNASKVAHVLVFTICHTPFLLYVPAF